MRGIVGVLCVLLLTACSKPEATNAPAPTLSITVIGDSYTEGTDTGGIGPNKWPSLVSARLRQDGIETTTNVEAEGGAGYTTPGYKGHTFAELAGQGVQPHDDLVIYFGSSNDGYPNGLDVPAAVAAVHDTFSKTRATAPMAKLMVIGPASLSDPPAAYEVALSDILRDQAARVDATFVDALAEKWLQNDSALKASDGIHPNDAGQRYLADKIEPLVAAQLRDKKLSR